MVEISARGRCKLDAVQYPLAQEGKPGLAIHHALNELHPRHMAFDLTV